jgi:hypothetical protein
VDWFLSRGDRVNSKYPYILANWEDWPRNMILPEVAKYIEEVSMSQREKGLNFPLHKYVHHGLSSQAMLFNLVGPLLVRNDLGPLRKLLEGKGLNWPGNGSSIMFEYEDRGIFNEDSGQPTSIDLVVLDGDGFPRIFVESKFVEQELGSCSVFAAGDCDGRNPSQDLKMCYLHHIGRRYWALIREYGIDRGLIGSDSTCIPASY